MQSHLKRGTAMAVKASSTVEPQPQASDLCPQLALAKVPVLATDSISEQVAVMGLTANAKSRATLTDVYARYAEWCADEGLKPAVPGDFAEVMGILVKAAGIRVSARADAFRYWRV
jgi:hypothetical protein